MDFHLVANGTDETQPLPYQWEIHVLMAASIAAMIAHRIPMAGLIFFLATFFLTSLSSLIEWLARKAKATSASTFS